MNKIPPPQLSYPKDKLTKICLCLSWLPLFPNSIAIFQGLHCPFPPPPLPHSPRQIAVCPISFPLRLAFVFYSQWIFTITRYAFHKLCKWFKELNNCYILIYISNIIWWKVVKSASRIQKVCLCYWYVFKQIKYSNDSRFSNFYWDLNNTHSVAHCV